MPPSRSLPALLTVLLWTALWVVGVRASSSTLSSSGGDTTASLPRSRNRRRWSSSSSSSSISFPPWNPSDRIADDGFLSVPYFRTAGDWEAEMRFRTRHKLDMACRIRQVPGDGNCLFHSISLCLQHATNGTHWDFQADSSNNKGGSCLDELYAQSSRLRGRAVDCLRDHKRRLFLQGRESLQSGELVEAAAQQYGLSSEEYCEAMQQDCVWGGGPEIVALSNLLQRPIHVYELATATDSSSNKESAAASSFVLRRMACFGSPRFDRKEALHILSADSRFPDLLPGEQLAAGNHFLAVFPLRRRSRLRGGSTRTGGLDKETVDDKASMRVDAEATDSRWSVVRWWRQWLE